MSNLSDENQGGNGESIYERNDTAAGAGMGLNLPEPHEAAKDRISSVEPWEEGENTQGFQHGSWNYVHGTRNEVGPALAEPGNDQNQTDTTHAQESNE